MSSDTNLKDDSLKLVRYKVFFVKRDLEHAFEEKEELIADNISESAYVSWKIADFISHLDQVARPSKWLAKNYPAAAQGATIVVLPEGDKKYFRVHFEVLTRYTREEFKQDEKKVAVLEDIRDVLQQCSHVIPTPTYKVRLPATLRMGGSLNPAESEFGDEFWNFPPLLGEKPKPGGTFLAGRLTFEFKEPVGPRADFSIIFNGTGTDDEIHWGGGQNYHFVRDHTLDEEHPFLNDGQRNIGTLNLETGEIENLRIGALFQNSVIGMVDRLNRIPFGFPNFYPPPDLPPGFSLPFTERPPIFTLASFSYDAMGFITGFEFHGQTIAPITIFPKLGVFPPFSFGPHGEFYFANPTSCADPMHNCPTDPTNPDGIELLPNSFFHPHFDLVTDTLREIPKNPEAPPCLPEEIALAAAAEAGGQIYVFGGGHQGVASNAMRIYSPADGSWRSGPPMPIGLRDASAVTIQTKIYLLGGRGSDDSLSQQAFVFDTEQQTWTELASMGQAVASAAAAAVGDSIFVIGGWTHGEKLSQHVQVYSTETGSWSNDPVAPKFVATNSIVGVVGPLILIAGGKQEHNVSKECWIYNTRKQVWTEAPPMETAVFGASSGIIDDFFYIFGGLAHPDGEPIRLTQIYDIARNRWWYGEIGPLPTAFSSSAVIDGAIYVLGGAIATGLGRRHPSRAVQVFHPGIGWTTCSQMPLFCAEDVMNSASVALDKTHAFSPGCRVIIAGTNLSSVTNSVLDALGNTFTSDAPLSMGGVSITVDGEPAPIISVSPTLVEFQVPFSLNVAGKAGRQVRLEFKNASSQWEPPVIHRSLKPVSPGAFIYNFDELREPGYLTRSSAKALNQDEKLNYPANAAHPGELITVVTTGLGTVTPQIDSGLRAPSTPPSVVTKKIKVKVGTEQATDVAAILLPSTVGTYGVRFRIPDNAAKANNVVVEITCDGVETNVATVSIL